MILIIRTVGRYRRDRRLWPYDSRRAAWRLAWAKECWRCRWRS